MACKYCVHAHSEVTRSQNRDWFRLKPFSSCHIKTRHKLHVLANKGFFPMPCTERGPRDQLTAYKCWNYQLPIANKEGSCTALISTHSGFESFECCHIKGNKIEVNRE